MMKQWRVLMAKIPTLRARAKENHWLNHGGSSQRQSSGFNQLFLADIEAVIESEAWTTSVQLKSAA